MPVTITATRTSSLFTDQDNDGKVDLGDTLFIRLDLTNTGDTDALNSVVNDALLGQTLVAGSINISPVAINYVFNAVGNTQLLVGTGATGLAGPSLTFGGAGIVSNVNLAGDNFTTNSLDAGTFATSGGGSVVISANGTFAYNPLAGFQGADTFTYTLRDTGQDGIAGNSDDLTSTARVTINVGNANGMVWYVDTTKGTNGDGTSDNPFNTFANVNGAGGAGDADSANHVIYAQGAVTADVVMEAGQSLIGTGAALVVGGFTLAAAGTSNTFTHGAGTGVLLSTDNTLRGFNINGTDANGVGLADNNGSVGNLTISAMSISGSGQAIDIDQGGNLNVALGTLSSSGAGTNLQGVQLAGTASSGAGLIQGTFSATGGTIGGSQSHGFQIGSGSASSGGTIAVDYDGAINSSITGSAVHITNRLAGAGTISFDGNIFQNSGVSSTTSGIVMNTIAGGTIAFTGTKQLTIGSGANNAIDIIANSGATVNFSGGALDLDTVNGHGLSIGSQTGGSVNISTAADIDATGTGRGINVTASTGGAINFTGGNVTISTASGTGIASATGTALTITGAGNTIATTTGQILDLAATSLGASGINFASLASNGLVTTGSGIISLNGTSGGALNATSVTIAGVVGAGTVDAVNITNASNAVTLSGGTIGNTNGDGVEINGGTGAVTIGASITKTTAGNVVEVNNHETGNVTFSGNITATGGFDHGIFVTNSNSGTIAFTGQTINLATGTNAAVNLTSNSGGTINFAPAAGGDGLDITTSTGAGFTATGGGTVSLTGTGNTINAGNGAAIDIQNTNIGAADFTLQSVTSNGGSANGITLINTGSAGGLHVTGNGTNVGATGGGFIANKTGADGSTTLGSGIYLSNTAEVELNGLLLQNFSNYGIRGIAVNGFSLTNSTVETTTGTNGNNTAFDEGSVFFGAFDYSVNGATGTVVFNNVRVEDGIEGGVNLLNNAGTTNVTVTNSTFQNNLNSGFLIAAGGTNNMTAVFTGSTFADNDAKGLQIQTNAGGAMNARVGTNGVGGSGGTLSGNNVGLSLEHNSTGAFTFNVLNATLSNGQGAPVSADVAPLQLNNLTGGSGAFSGNMIGNTVTNYAASAGPAVRLVQNSQTAGILTLNFANNNVTNNAANIGVQLLARDGNGDVNFTMTGNTITNTNALASHVFQVNAGAASGDTNEVNLDIRTNTFSQTAAAENSGQFDIRLARITTATGRIEGYAGSATDATAIGNYLAGLNTGAAGNGAGTNGVSTGISTTGTGWGNIASVPMPASPLMVAFLPVAAPAAEGPPADAPAAAAQAQAQAQTPQQGAFFGPGNKFNGIPGALGFANDAPPMDVVKVYDPVTGKLFDHDAGAAAADAERGLTGAPANAQQASSAPGETGGPDVVRIVAASAPSPIVDDGVLTQAELDWLVEAAIQRWIEAGASAEQVTAMRAAKITAADLGGLMLGQSVPGAIVLDDNGAGHNWYLDATPGDDSEFKLVGGTWRGAADTIEGTRVDLLTTIMHELGHQIGLDDLYDSKEFADVMYGFINPGERRLPTREEVEEADGVAPAQAAFALGAIALGTFEQATSRSISWKTTYDGPGTNRVITDVSNTSTVTYNNGGGPIIVNSTTNTLGPATPLAIDVLTLGGTIWNDSGVGAGGVKGNGVLDGTEPGINGVALSLFVDANNDNVADTPGASIATAVTAGGGNYTFTNLAPGNYIVRVDQSNFDAGGPLLGAQTSSVTSPEPVDPDNNVNNDDNGARSSGNPAFSYALTLDYNSEPTNDGDADADTNFTLDFGFLTPNQEENIVALGGDTVSFLEDGVTPVKVDQGGNAAIAVVDSNDYAGGSLTISITANKVAGEDQLGIDVSGTVTITGGNELRVGGTQIGTITSAGGAGGGDIVISLNTSANSATLDDVLRNLTYFNSNTANPSTLTRTISYTLVDGDGALSGGDDTVVRTSTVTVTAVDDAPQAVADSYTTDENVILNVAAGSGVLFNDTDVDGGPKTVASINGNPANVGVAVTLASGAKVTLNADGSLSYDPNGQFNYLVPAAAGTGAVNTSAVDSFTYALNGGSSTTVNVTVNGVAGAGDQLRGDAGNNIINGTSGNDAFRLQQGGDDVVNGGNGDDGFYFGAAFTSADQVDGGAGTNDQIGLQGNYAALSLTSAMIANVEVIALLSGGITTFGDTANNFYDYNLTVPAGTVAVNNRLTIQGTSLRAGEDFTFNGSASAIEFITYGGLGVDNLTGGSGNDGFYFGEGRFSSSDIVNGGAGTNDQLGLDGNYGTAGTPFELSGANISGVELIALLQYTGASTKTYFVSANNSLVANGQTMTIWGVPVQTAISFNGSAEIDGGKFIVYGGAGADTLIGGSGDDWLHGALGGDSLTGGDGADIFAYTAAAQSTGVNFDRLIRFDDNADKIDLPGAGTVTGFATAASGALSLATFDANLAAGVNAALGANQAIVFTANGGDMNGRIFGVVDVNGDGDYQAGTDYVFEFVSPVTPIDQLGMFI